MDNNKNWDAFTWYAIGCQTENEKYYYYATRIRNSQSILHAFPDNAIHVNACRTKKEAQEIVTYWNECAKRNGNYAFAEPLF